MTMRVRRLFLWLNDSFSAHLAILRRFDDWLSETIPTRDMALSRYYVNLPATYTKFSLEGRGLGSLFGGQFLVFCNFQWCYIARIMFEITTIYCIMSRIILKIRGFDELLSGRAAENFTKKLTRPLLSIKTAGADEKYSDLADSAKKSRCKVHSKKEKKKFKEKREVILWQRRKKQNP